MRLGATDVGTIFLYLHKEIIVYIDLSRMGYADPTPGGKIGLFPAM